MCLHLQSSTYLHNTHKRTHFKTKKEFIKHFFFCLHSKKHINSYTLLTVIMRKVVLAIFQLNITDISGWNGKERKVKVKIYLPAKREAAEIVNNKKKTWK